MDKANGLDAKMIYSLGQRDSLALVLMEAKFENRRLPKEAEQYRKHFGEHASLNFHLCKSKS